MYIYSSEAYAREQTQIVRKLVSEHNGSDFVFAEEPEAKKELWKVVINYNGLLSFFFLSLSPNYLYIGCLQIIQTHLTRFGFWMTSF